MYQVLDAKGIHSLVETWSCIVERARYAPSFAEAAKVANLLKADGFTVSGIGPDNVFVKASASVGLVQSTFQVELHKYDLTDGRSCWRTP